MSYSCFLFNFTK